jgi:hypothetical protein
MDPYLEDPAIWRGFHHGFAEEVRAQLNQTLGPGYYADLEVHTVLEEVDVLTTYSVYPDAAVLGMEPTLTTTKSKTAVQAAPIVRVLPETEQHKLRTVQIRRTDTHQLVTAIEILSPYNKRGDGLDLYRAKRWRLIRSDVHLVELDLLRGGSRPGPELQNPPIITDYVILLNRYNLDGERRRSEIWPVALSEPLPSCPIPLLSPDPDVILELTEVMQNVYVRSAYDRRLDYTQPVPSPALRPAMEEWLADRIKPNGR